MFKPDVTVNEAMDVLKSIDKQLKIRNVLEIARIRNVAHADGVHSEIGFEMDDKEFQEFLANIWDDIL